MNKLLALLALPLLVGCANGQTNPASPTPLNYDIRLDPKIDPRLSTAAFDAVADWQKAIPALSDATVTVTGQDCTPNDTACIFVTAEPHTLILQVGANFLAYTHNEQHFDSRIELPSDIFDLDLQDELPVVCRHELGHAFGLSHVQSTNAIMYPNNAGVGHITCSDVVQFSQVHGLPMPDCKS